MAHYSACVRIRESCSSVTSHLIDVISVGFVVSVNKYVLLEVTFLCEGHGARATSKRPFVAMSAHMLIQPISGNKSFPALVALVVPDASMRELVPRKVN